MLDDFAAQHGTQHARSVLKRLEDKRIDQVLPAEMELALIWALSRLGDVEVEPEWWGDEKRPDAYTEALVWGEPAAVEIAAPSDNALSGEEAMDRIALAVSGIANKARRGIADFFYYRFQEEMGYENGQYFRRRLVPDNHGLSAETERRIREWTRSNPGTGSRLRIVEPGLDVEIERSSHRQARYHNTWSSMPPEALSIDNNPLYKLLKRKLRQLKAARHGTHRFIFLADAGSTLLNRLGSPGEINPTGRTFSGREILGHFVSTNRSAVDAVVAFAPRRPLTMVTHEGPYWAVSVFCRPGFKFDLGPLEQLAHELPEPRLEGYEARSLFRQGMFDPKAPGWWLGMQMSCMVGGPVDIEISSRALMDFLAGRIDVDAFRREMGQRAGEKNMFEHWLNMGFTVQNIAFKSAGLDEDDDHLVITLGDDPAARPLKLTQEPDIKT